MKANPVCPKQPKFLPQHSLTETSLLQPSDLFCFAMRFRVLSFPLPSFHRIFIDDLILSWERGQTYLVLDGISFMFKGFWEVTFHTLFPLDWHRPLVQCAVVVFVCASWSARELSLKKGHPEPVLQAALSAVTSFHLFGQLPEIWDTFTAWRADSQEKLEWWVIPRQGRDAPRCLCALPATGPCSFSTCAPFWNVVPQSWAVQGWCCAEWGPRQGNMGDPQLAALVRPVLSGPCFIRWDDLHSWQSQPRKDPDRLGYECCVT